MSRTVRSRRQSFEVYYGTNYQGMAYDEFVTKYLKIPLPTAKAQYYSKTRKWYTYALPKHYRKMINKLRRVRDKREIHKALTLVDYPEQCSMWNCKDAQSWGYW